MHARMTGAVMMRYGVTLVDDSQSEASRGRIDSGVRVDELHAPVIVEARTVFRHHD